MRLTISYSQTSCRANSFHFPSHGKPFSLHLDRSPSPSRGIVVMGSIGIGRSYLVKYLAANSYFPFITVFLRKFLGTKETIFSFFDYDTDDEMDDTENGPMTRKGDDKLNDSYDSDVDVEKELRSYSILDGKENRIPDIHDMHINKSNYLSCCPLVKYISMNCERSSINLAITSSNILQKKMFRTNGFRSITLSFNVRDLVALINEAISISIIGKKSIIDTNTIRFVIHRQTWGFQFDKTPIVHHGILFYQMGRALAQNVLLSHCLIDPISIYMKKKSCNAVDSYLYKWCFELGTSMKKLMILFYLLSYSTGSVAQDLWSPPGPNEKKGIASYGLVYNDFALVHGLLEVEDALVGLLRTEKEND
ncbi:hypothetical protein Cgig2_026898 [Carnegiea gigantea]|uniref:Protein Ycf2 n=1 Tax=Carnegiea gigantea TaxID=171969 RepID=A0A9Q1KY96_9CARY|nr:hypothetical protein Cgig2_026898 [Carnegiea gigantea]